MRRASAQQTWTTKGRDSGRDRQELGKRGGWWRAVEGERAGGDHTKRKRLVFCSRGFENRFRSPLISIAEAVDGAAAGRTGRARRDQSAGEAAGPDVASSGALCPACHAQRRLCPARSEDYETEAEHGLHGHATTSYKTAPRWNRKPGWFTS
jgi:hypothetical protein